MALTVNFSVAQNFATPTVIDLVDTSVGSDPTITQRRVYLVKADGTFLVPIGTTTPFVFWNYSLLFTNINVLNKDYALSITVEWLNASNSVVYSKNAAYCFKFNLDFFLYNLGNKLATTPDIESDYNFMGNAYKLDTLSETARRAVEYGGNIQNAQSALDSAKKIMDNSAFYF